MLYAFLFGMWMLILIGGGIAVTVLGPIHITCCGELDSILTSITKGVISIGLVVLWIVILSKMKHWMLNKTFEQ